MKLIHFQKKLGLPGAVAVAVGAVIGVGIFVIVGPIGANTGPWMPLAFAVAAVPAILGALVAMALGGTIPADGGGFFYTRTLLGRVPGAVTSLLIVTGALGAVGAVSIGVADYFIHSYFAGAPRAALAVGIVLFAYAINAAGIMTSEKLQIVLIANLVLALAAVICVALAHRTVPAFSEPLPAGVPGFLQGAVVAMLSYTGFNIMGELGDEVDNPRRNVPLTIALGLAIVICIYVGVGWVVAGTMSVEELRQSKAALLESALKLMPHPAVGHFLNLAALCAGVTAINAAFLAVPRELSALAEDGLLPRWVMAFNPRRQTFPAAIAITTALGVALTLLDLDPDAYGLLAVAGLMLANAILSVAALRLTHLFPDKAASAPIPVKDSWLKPAAALSVVLSLGFTVLAVAFFRPVGLAVAVAAVAGIALARRAPPRQ